MTTRWNEKNGRHDSDAGNYRSAFQEHNGCVRLFRGSHTSGLEVNASKQDRPALPADMCDLYIGEMVRETGGKRDPATAAAWLILMFMWKLTPYKFSQN